MLISFFKKLHDIFQDIEISYNLLKRDCDRLPHDQEAWDLLELNEDTLVDYLDNLLSLTEIAPATITLSNLISRIKKIKLNINLSIEDQDLKRLNQGLKELFREIDKGLTNSNSNLITAAKEFPIDDLISNLSNLT